MKHMHMATILLLLALAAGPSAASAGHSGPAVPETPAAAPSGLLFIENIGQWPDAGRFQVWGSGQTLWLAEDALWLTVVERSNVDTLARFDPQRVDVERENVPRENVQRVNVKLSFPGANPQPELEPFDRLDTHVSYFIGADPEKWRADVPVWGGVRYRDLYPGVDLIVGAGLAPALDGGRPQGSPLQWRLEGADLGAIRLRVEGADAVAVDDDALRLSTALGELAVPLLGARPGTAAMPQIETPAGEAAMFEVQTPFTASSGEGSSAIAAGTGLRYATFLSGSSYDYGFGVAVDSAGQAYVTGATGSAGFPASLGPGYDTSYNGGADAFVVKLNAAGTGLRYATFLGGSRVDWGTAIAVDGAGQAHVTGYTDSADFPASRGPGYDTTYNGGRDAFVVKLFAISQKSLPSASTDCHSERVGPLILVTA